MVSFDGKVVMGLTFNQIVGQLPLGQQGIGGNLFTLYIDVIQQGNSHRNLVSSFDLFVTGYGQGIHFFWV